MKISSTLKWFFTGETEAGKAKELHLDHLVATVDAVLSDKRHA